MSEMVWLHAIYCKCEQCVRVRGDASDEDEPEIFRANSARGKSALTSEGVSLR